MPYFLPFVLCKSYAESLVKRALIKLRANNAKSADNPGTTVTKIALSGNIVEVYPLSTVALNNSFCAQYHTVFIGIGEAIENCAKRIKIKLFSCFNSIADKDLVSVMVMMLTVLVLMSTGAFTVFIVIVMVMMLTVLVVVSA